MSRFIHTQEKSGDRTESAMLANLFTIKHTFLFDRILQLGQFHIPVIAHGEQTAILTLVDIITISNVLLIPHRSSVGSHLERRAHRLVVLGEVMSAGALEVQVHGRGRRRCRGRRCLRGCGDDVCVTVIGSGTGHRTSHHGSCADHGSSAYHSACDGCGASSSNDNSRRVMVMVMTAEHGSERMRLPGYSSSPFPTRKFLFSWKIDRMEISPSRPRKFVIHPQNPEIPAKRDLAWTGIGSVGMRCPH